MTFPAFLLSSVVYFVQCFQQQLCQAPEYRSLPSGDVCFPLHKLLVLKWQGMHLTSLPFHSSLCHYRHRQETTRPKHSWNKVPNSQGCQEQILSIRILSFLLLRVDLAERKAFKETKQTKKKETALVTSWQWPHCGLVSTINSLL